jgi:release factor glutamine methyltransferase
MFSPGVRDIADAVLLSARTGRVYVGRNMPDTVSSLLQGVDDLPDHESIRLLLAAAGADRTWMLGNPAVSGEVADRFGSFVGRRRRGEPLQHIEGSVRFGPIDLQSDGRALIPRPETERLWELCVALLEGIEAPVIVDLCTGSGNLALALKHAIPDAEVLGTDLSRDAISLAAENRAGLGLDVTFIEGDLFAVLPRALRQRVDLMVSNPPYVSDGQYLVLPTEITDYEPRSALVAGPDGLDVLRRIAAGAIDWLRPGGAIVCEIGETQGDLCRSIFSTYQPAIERDLAGRDRFVLGCAPMPRDLH